MYGDKLLLKNPMDRTWLIQRLRKPVGHIDPFSFGGGLKNGGIADEGMNLLKGIFSFDYMGAAEFEFGAVPAALTLIWEEAAKGKVVSGEHQGVYYICPISYEVGVKRLIGKLLEDESSVRLKEPTQLHYATNPRKADDNHAVGWLELDNGFFFFTDAEMFQATKRLLELQ